MRRDCSDRAGSPSRLTDVPPTTTILGISAFYHDSAATLVADGEIVAAAQEERFTRRKHDQRFPIEAVRYCLREAGLTAADLDYVAFYEKPLAKFERLIETYSAFAPSGFSTYLTALQPWLRSKLHLQRELHRGAWRRISRPHRLHRSSRVARGQRVLPVAIRRSRHPDARRRRRVGHHHAWPRPRQRHPADPRDPLSALARPALQRLHLLHRLPRELGRVQGDGPCPVRRTSIRAADSPAPDPRQRRRLVLDGPVVFQLLRGHDDDEREVPRALRRAAARPGIASHATGHGSGGVGPGRVRRGDAEVRAPRCTR